MIRAEIGFEGNEWCIGHGNDLGTSSSSCSSNGSDLSCYSGNSDESSGPIPAWKAANSDESASLIPIWKDDDDGSSYGDRSAQDNRFGGIPSTLEFTVLLDFEVARGEDYLPPPVSPSTLSSQIQTIGADFPSLPSLETMDQPPNKDDLGISEIAADMVSSAERLNSFRRRLHSSMDIGNGSLSESQSSSRPQSPPLYLLSSPPPRYNIVRRASPRFVLLFGAIILVFLSVHDSIQNSRRYYREQYRLLSSDTNNRREEVAFPIVQVQVHSDEATTTTRTTYQRQTNGHEHNQNEYGHGHEYSYHAELPKFETPRNINSIRGGSVSTGGRAHNNIVMARAKEHPRPIFVPDTPLPNGGFRKPLERFVFDDSRELNQHQQSGRRFAGREYSSSSSSSWTSWMVSLVLIAMLFDTGWREYRRCRIGGIPPSRDE